MRARSLPMASPTLGTSEVRKSPGSLTSKPSFYVAIRRGEGAQRKRCRDPRCSPRGNPACRGTFGPGKCSGPRPGSPVPSTPERREGLRACYWEGPSELPERTNGVSLWLWCCLAQPGALGSRESSLLFRLERGPGIALQAMQEKKALISR